MLSLRFKHSNLASPTATASSPEGAVFCHNIATSHPAPDSNPACPWFVRLAPRLIIAYCLVAPLSIAAANVAIIPLVVAWLVHYSQSCSRITSASLQARQFSAAILTFALAALFASFVGVAPLRSLNAWLSLVACLPLPFAVAASLDNDFLSKKIICQRGFSYFAALCLGQTIASLETLAHSLFSYELPLKLPGALTESGQLVFVTTLTYVLYCASQRFANTLALRGHRFYTAAFLLVLPILCSALVLNLKRGPWLGVLVSFSLLGLLLSRRLLLSVLGLSITCVLLVSPVRDRLSALYDHFVIEGGRSNMWSLGLELMQSFPLGVGLKNAEYMRQLDPSLPATHRHMHNNVLNVAVENGWLGLCAYLWWMYLAIALGFRFWRKSLASSEPETQFLGLLALATGCALLGWQIAGLVEYNFGDREIRLMALMVMGVGLGIVRSRLR